jgi:hypothetical protein
LIASHHLALLLEETSDVRKQLQTHRVYSSIRSIEDVRRFMETHVFAVWDFMSLLKALQRGLTCVEVPWIPVESAAGRFVNEIVRDEESDIGLDGQPISHFELYRLAMKEAGADTNFIKQFLAQLRAGSSVRLALERAGAPSGACQFVLTTFDILQTGRLHEVAAAFAFGREDVIPDMFRAIISDLAGQIPGLATFQYYLRRHVEIDGDDHGPLSHRMVMELCGTNARLWQEATETTARALVARIALWDSVLSKDLTSEFAVSG